MRKLRPHGTQMVESWDYILDLSTKGTLLCCASSSGFEGFITRLSSLFITFNFGHYNFLLSTQCSQVPARLKSNTLLSVPAPHVP